MFWVYWNDFLYYILMHFSLLKSIRKLLTLLFAIKIFLLILMIDKVGSNPAIPGIAKIETSDLSFFF